jgi:hypothetical protein
MPETRPLNSTKEGFLKISTRAGSTTLRCVPLAIMCPVRSR